MVRPKKHLGQHFLIDSNICEKIANSLTRYGNYKILVEIGPGMGALTKILIENKGNDLFLIEKDKECVVFLENNLGILSERIIQQDFLRINIKEFWDQQLGIIGNFPYNISTQILFKILDFKDLIPEVVGMFQKEVAERICEKPGTKKYGIISVLIQAYYEVEYLFTVSETVFSPPPKVKSGVIRLKRKRVNNLSCDESLFRKIVKMSFNQRRKTLRNSLKQIIGGRSFSQDVFALRPERLSVDDFVELTKLLE